MLRVSGCKDAEDKFLALYVCCDAWSGWKDAEWCVAEQFLSDNLGYLWRCMSCAESQDRDDMVQVEIEGDDAVDPQDEDMVEVEIEGNDGPVDLQDEEADE